jgi:hypothetical protein
LQQLEWRAEAISEQFNSQNVANTLLAFATMRTKPGQRMIEQHQFIIACDIKESLGMRLPASIYALKAGV